MRAILRPLFAQKSTTDWLAILADNGVPCGPINTIEQICESEQIAAREMMVEVGGIKVPGNPMKFLRQHYANQYPRVPEIGEQTAAVKQEFSH